MKTIMISEGQNLFDLALQQYGSIEGIFWIIEDNITVVNSIDASLVAGMVLNIRDAVIDSEVINYYERNKTQVNTGDPAGDEGIEFWGIEEDFVVT
jgi:hypothetical protein